MDHFGILLALGLRNWDGEVDYVLLWKADADALFPMRACTGRQVELRSCGRGRVWLAFRLRRQ
jgi:hypothetical protein